MRICGALLLPNVALFVAIFAPIPYPRFYMRGKIFILYLGLILSVTFMLNMFGIAFSLWMDQQVDHARWFTGGGVLALLLLLFCLFRIKRGRLGMVEEVAIILYPLGALLSLAVSVWLAWELRSALLNSSHNPYLLVFSGLVITGYIIIRSFEIKFLPSIDDLEGE